MKPAAQLGLDHLDRPGEHLWVLAAAFAVADPERPLERPPLGAAQGHAEVGCWKCERAYSRRLAKRPCTGSVTS